MHRVFGAGMTVIEKFGILVVLCHCEASAGGSTGMDVGSPVGKWGQSLWPLELKIMPREVEQDQTILKLV